MKGDKMINKDETEKSCYNCKYFKKHYVKDNTQYHWVACGACYNREFTINDRRKKFPYYVACDKWEAIENDFHQRKQSIEEVLRTMADHIDQMLQILKDG